MTDRGGATRYLRLPLLTASAKSFYDTQMNEETEMAANAVLLDRMLDHYGRKRRVRVSLCELR